MPCWCNSRSRLFNRFEYGLAESIQPSPFSTSAKRLTYSAAAHPETDVILLVGDGIPVNVSQNLVAGQGGTTLVMVRRALAEVMAIWAGGMGTVSILGNAQGSDEVN